MTKDLEVAVRKEGVVTMETVTTVKDFIFYN